MFKLCLNNGCTWNVRIYYGKEATPGATVFLSVVMKLIESLLNTGRLLYTSNSYTIIHMVYLLPECSSYLVGTLRLNRKLDPENVVKAELKKNEQITKESNTGVVILKWKDKRDVFVPGIVHGEERKEFTQGEAQQKKKIIDSNNSKTWNKMVLEVGS
jgi:hypothetical protein